MRYPQTSGSLIDLGAQVPGVQSSSAAEASRVRPGLE